MRHQGRSAKAQGPIAAIVEALGRLLGAAGLAPQEAPVPIRIPVRDVRRPDAPRR